MPRACEMLTLCPVIVVVGKGKVHVGESQSPVEAVTETTADTDGLVVDVCDPLLVQDGEFEYSGGLTAAGVGVHVVHVVSDADECAAEGEGTGAVGHLEHRRAHLTGVAQCCAAHPDEEQYHYQCCAYKSFHAASFSILCRGHGDSTPIPLFSI
jgi:hypothetical protein